MATRRGTGPRRPSSRPGPASAGTATRRLSCAGTPQRLAENAGRPEQQDDHEQHKGDDILPGSAIRDDRRAVVLGQTEDEAAEQGSPEVADAAQNGCRERLDAEHEAGVVAGG